MRDERTDAILRALSDGERREIVAYLRRGEDDLASVDELAAFLAARDVPTADETSRTRESAAIAARHVHLPLLSEQDVVEFDARSGAVRYQSDERVEAVLDSLGVSIPDSTV